MFFPTLEDLVGDTDVFLEKHFNRSAFLNRSALADHVDDILTLADLDELLRLRAIRAPYVRIARAGASVREADFTCDLEVQHRLVTDAIDAESVYTLLRGGATVTWSTINHVRTNLRRMCAHLSAAFNTPSDAIAFLTPAGREGFAPHHDPVDVFVVQLVGTKSWRFWETPEQRAPIAGHYKAEELGEPTCQTTLCPGDVLYLPYGTPHVARTEDDLSLHLSVTVEPRTWRDALRRVVTSVLEEEESLGQPLGLGRAENGKEAAELRRVIDVLAQRLREVDTDQAWNRFSAPLNTEDGAAVISALGAVDLVSATDLVRCGSGLVLGFGQPHEGRTTVTLRQTHSGYRETTALGAVGESSLNLPSPLAGSLRQLSESGSAVTITDAMVGLSGASALDTARKLIRAGVLEICRDR